jgi:hypothetical protein
MWAWRDCCCHQGFSIESVDMGLVVDLEEMGNIALDCGSGVRGSVNECGRLNISAYLWCICDVT